ncbi:MAG: hypothetical protein HFI48_16785 [Lachnospiraceae bacterium]|nr:hypothetical protein [Lachnospiraceae bacterium]
MEKIVDLLKGTLNGNKPFVRKLRILRYVACVIILFILFCDSYWNLLAYIDLPCAPLLEENVRGILHKSGIVVFICWMVYSVSFCSLYRIKDGKHWMNLSYIDILFDFALTVYFVAYALNIGIEYANGLQVQVKVEAILAVLYLMYCALHKSYKIHQINFEKNKIINYTNYCDSEGKQIPVNAKVFYKGKGYRIVEYKGVYRLLSCEEKIISSTLITLENAASDVEGKLLVHK